MEDDKMLDLMEAAERLEAVMASLEQAAQRLAEREAVGPIVATVDDGPSLREQELERRLAEAEAKLVQLQAQAQAAPAMQQVGRRTLAPGTASLLAKQGVAVDATGGGMALEAAALDGALSSLSIEQRIAVKAELLRAGLLG